MLLRNDLLQMIEALGGSNGLVYVSVPITSGERAVEAMDRIGLRSIREARSFDPAKWLAEVQTPNESDARATVAAVRAKHPNRLVLNPAALAKPGWGDDDYNGLWLDVISTFANTVVPAPGWAWSRGGRLEVAAALALRIPLEDIHGRALSCTDLDADVDIVTTTLTQRGWELDDVDQLLPPFVAEVSKLHRSPQSETFEWLIGERGYQLRKFGTDLDDKHTLEGVGQDSWWWQQLFMYLHRSSILGLHSEVGRQAVAKFAATACGLLESVIRTHGPLPLPGVPSGELGNSTEQPSASRAASAG